MGFTLDYTSYEGIGKAAKCFAKNLRKVGNKSKFFYEILVEAHDQVVKKLTEAQAEEKHRYGCIAVLSLVLSRYDGLLVCDACEKPFRRGIAFHTTIGHGDYAVCSKCILVAVEKLATFKNSVDPRG